MRKSGLSSSTTAALPAACRAACRASHILIATAAIIASTCGSAQDPTGRRDDALRVSSDRSLPVTGSWRSLTQDNTRLVHNLPAQERADRLLSLAVRTREEIAAELGVSSDEVLTVYLCKDVASFRQAAGSEPRREQVGIAVPGRHEIVALAFRDGAPTDLSEVIVHEVSHIVLADAAGDDLPRWFQEGFALYQSHQLTVPEAYHLALAGVTGRLIPLSEIDGRFPYGTRLSRLAYAQSLDSFTYLSARIGLDGVGALARDVGRHGSFTLAFRNVYGTGSREFERSWRASLTRRYRWVLLTSGWIPLLLVVTVVAGLLKLRGTRRTLDRWEQEERGYTGAAVQPGRKDT
jgi:hypothetical protein